MRFDLACLGEPLFEFNQTRADGDYRPGFGGDVSNCAIAAARQGARVAMITAVGCDSFGDRFLDLWRDEGIDTGAVRRLAGLAITFPETTGVATPTMGGVVFDLASVG